MSSKLLIDEPPLQVLPSLAKKIGLNEAIFLQQLHFLTRDSRNGEMRLGFRWIYNTLKQWQEFYPFMSRRTVQRTIENLERDEWIVVCHPEPHNRRGWYRVNAEKFATV